MKYISICSGIEAATTAWHGLGWEPLAFSEIDAFPSAVLAERYPEVPNLGDMTKYREWPEELLAECELLVGGTPCQAFSVAGLRKSLDDERGNLSLTYVHLFHRINEVRKRHGRPPAIAVWENVPGVLSTKDNAFGCFIGGLLGCDEAPQTESGKWDKAGFLGSETVRVGYRILDAQYFAVAQRRRRVFLVAVPCELVASLGERSCPSEILSLRESVLGNPPTRGEAWEGVARGAAECAASGGADRELANTLTARMGKGINTTCDEGQTPVIVSNDPAHAICHNEQRTYTNEGKVFQLRNCVAQAATVVAQGFTYSGYSNQPAWMTGDRTDCLPASGHSDGSHQGVGVQSGMQVRRLTPTECCRLQGFPDDHCDIIYRKKPASDGPKYRALGNSMAVPCMAWIGYRISLATRQH